MTRETALNILWCIAAIAAVALVVFTPGCLFASQAVLREPISDVCCLIERNNFYDGEGRLVFTQFIWWGDELPYPNRVREWRLDKGGPVYLRRMGNAWRMVFEDNGTIREVRAPSYIETWTQHDPELADREFVRSEERLGFRHAAVIVLPPHVPFVLETPAEGP